MSRIRIDMPERFPFATELPVRVTDLNYGRHVGNDTVLALLHEARVQFLASHGLREDDVGGCGLLLVDAALVYRAQMLYGDVLRIEVALAEPHARGFDLVYRVTKTPAGPVAVEAKTGMVFYDYSNGKVQRAPPQVRAVLGRASERD